MKQLRISALLLLLLTFVACPMDYDQNFRFSNNSTVDVYIYLGIVDRDLGGSLYPDTAIARVKCGVPFKQGESRLYSYSSAKEDVWRKNTLCLFIFDADTFNTHSWDEIKNGYKILRRYDISPENIETFKYKISYPPDERMKNMKMYPPYDE